MQTTIPLIDLEEAYRVVIQSFEEGGGKLTPDVLIRFSLQMFQELRVNEVNINQADSNMLLFQYGIYNWHDDNGEHFSFDITRQFILEGEDEAIFQLSWTLLYDAATFAEIESDSAWSCDFATLKEWEEYIKSTIGYQKACAVVPRSSKLCFNKV